MRLGNMLVFPAGNTDACRYAAAFLKQAGIGLTDHPSPEVTHFLLDVPSFGADGMLRGGGELQQLLQMLPQNVIVIGGNLCHPALSQYRTLDLLQDAEYLAVNAAITADCALQAAAPLMTTTIADSPTLIIGWGRIGKCLAQLLKAVGTDVTIAARKSSDRAMAKALGLNAVGMEELTQPLPQYRLIFNTAPELVLHKEQAETARNCVKIDLASKPGIEGSDVVWARGLPGIHAPESSGKLIAQSVLRLCKEEG